MKVDIAKRQRVMARSQKLGHCICDPRRPCPCDVFTEQGLCPCAGERPDPTPAASIRLTEWASHAGCASKIAPSDLETVLGRLPAVDDPAVLCGVPAGDDAGVYQLDGECLVQTVDVMTPCVDDARSFGRICAVNCVSDIYAMGGQPRTALSIMAFPSETLPGQLMYEMMAGAMEALAEAEVALIGGHSIKDDQIKLGFAITGVIDPQRATGHDTAQPGDRLVLTKPLGTGVLHFARQIGRVHESGLRQAEIAMATLNRVAAKAMVELAASACTDVTGFGLFGHLVSMARHSRLTAHVDVDVLPAFDGAVELLADDVVPGAVERNREYVGEDLVVDAKVDDARLHLGYDAQTSGGLLIAISEDRCQVLLDKLSRGGVTGHVIGRMTEQSTGRIVAAVGNRHLTLSATTEPSPASEVAVNDSNPSPEQNHDPDCCADVFGDRAETEAGHSTIGDARAAFGSLMRATNTSGAVDERTKCLINLALVTLRRCGPCLDNYLNKARKLGITAAEIDETIWCAVAIGGACVRVFHDQWVRRQPDRTTDSKHTCC